MQKRCHTSWRKFRGDDVWGYIRGAMIGKGVQEGGSVGGPEGVIWTGKGTHVFLSSKSFLLFPEGM